MKKKDFMCLLLGVVGGLLFAIGMCAVLIDSWNLRTEGIVITSIGAVLLLALAVIVYIINGKPKVKVNWSYIIKILYMIFSVLVFGLGMVMILVWNNYLFGIIVGVIGIILLTCIIPVLGKLTD